MTVSTLIGLESEPLADPSASKESLVGLDRSALADRLAALGVPERQRRMRVSQLWSWIYVRGATDFAAMTDIAKELRAELAEPFHPCAARRSSPSRSRSTARANGCCALRRRQGGGDRLHPRSGSRHAVHFEPGRLHAHLHLLPHRHAEARAQSDRRRDRRPDHARARSHRRLAGRHGRRHARTSRLRAQDHQCRAHGHGRAALQFRQCARCLRHRRRRRRTFHLQAPHHAVDLGRGAGDPALGRGGRHHARHLAARGARRIARRARAHQQEMADSRIASGAAATIPACPTPSASPSST